jgi:hypothetical protein
MGPDVDTYQNIGTSGMYSVLSTCDIPREVIIMLHEVCTLWDEDLKPIPQYKEILDKLPPPWEQSNTRISTEREYRLCYEALYGVFKPNFTLGYPGITTIIGNELATPLLNGTLSVTQAVDKIKPKIEDLIDQYK